MPDRVSANFEETRAKRTSSAFMVAAAIALFSWVDQGRVPSDAKDKDLKVHCIGHGFKKGAL
jgi:hypothetical protein